MCPLHFPIARAVWLCVACGVVIVGLVLGLCADFPSLVVALGAVLVGWLAHGCLTFLVLLPRRPPC